MAASPDWKVYDSHGTYQAACKEVEAAAALVGFYGAGATIRWGHRLVVWTEGSEEQPASESYDEVALLAGERVARAARDARERLAADAVRHDTEYRQRRAAS